MTFCEIFYFGFSTIEKSRIHLYDFQNATVLVILLLPVGQAWKTSKGGCPEAFWSDTWITFTGSFQVAGAAALSRCLRSESIWVSPATLWRKPISAACICDFISSFLINHVFSQSWKLAEAYWSLFGMKGEFINVCSFMKYGNSCNGFQQWSKDMIKSTKMSTHNKIHCSRG